MHQDRLFDAAVSGDLGRLEAALSSPAIDVNAVGESWKPYADQTCLHVAATSGNVQAIELLLAKGADINGGDESARTPLHDAAVSLHKPAVNILLEAGAPVNSVNRRRGRTIVYDLLRKGYRNKPEHLQFVEYLLDRGMDIDNPTGSDSEYSLIGDAACMGSLGFVQLLVRRGAKIPKETLTEVYDYDTAEFLIECGAKLVCKSENSVIVKAASSGHYELLELYLSHASDSDILASREAMHRAAEEGRLGTVEVLVSQGWDVNALSDEERETPLHSACACRDQDPDIVEMILELMFDAGADITTRDAHERTPLHRAAEAFNYHIIQRLIDQGADITATDDFSSTPLMTAAFEISHGFWAKSSNDDGYMAWPSFRSLKLLLQYTVDLDVQDRRGDTTLHILAYPTIGSCGGNHVTLLAARLLVEKGADITIRNHEGKTASELIARYDRHRVLQEKASGTDPRRYVYMMLL